MSMDSSDICQQLECWFDSPTGQYLLQQETALVADMLQQVFGYHLLQLGITRKHSLALDSAVNHKIYGGCGPGQDTDLLTASDCLPFGNDSIDVVLLHHCMDFAPNPHQLLREVQRVVAPQGHIIILGFNPWSLFGLGTKLRGRYPGSLWKQAAPMGVGRLRDWLHLLGSEVRTTSPWRPTSTVSRRANPRSVIG